MATGITRQSSTINPGPLGVGVGLGVWVGEGVGVLVGGAGVAVGGISIGVAVAIGIGVEVGERFGVRVVAFTASVVWVAKISAAIFVAWASRSF